MMCQDRLESVRRNLLRVLPYVDNAVVVDNGSTDGTREWLETLKPCVFPVFRAWDDSFVAGRNAYLRAVDRLVEAGELAEPVAVCVADDDELYSDGLLEDLREIAEEAYLDDLNLLRVRSRSVETDWKGDVYWSHDDEWHKPLIMVWEPGIAYRGIGRSEVHEDLLIPSGRREAILPDDGMRLRYDHVKRHGEIWLRGIRNFFAGGGGPNLGDLNPLWGIFLRLVGDCTSGAVQTADRFVKWLEAGDVHPDVLAWFRRYRLLGTRFDPTPPMWPGWPDGTSEVREGFLAYHLFLHPETMPPDLIEADREYMRYAAEARTIHGPNAPPWAAE